MFPRSSIYRFYFCYWCTVLPTCVQSPSAFSPPLRYSSSLFCLESHFLDSWPPICNGYCCNFKALMDSDQQMTDLPGSLDFSYQIYTTTSSLNGHSTLKNSFQQHLGRCYWCPVHMALGISLHSGFCSSNHCPLSEALSGFQRLLLLDKSVAQAMVNKHLSFLTPYLGLLVDRPEFPSGIKPQLPTLVTGLIAPFISYLLCLTFLLIFSEVPSWINSNNCPRFCFSGTQKQAQVLPSSMINSTSHTHGLSS